MHYVNIVNKVGIILLYILCLFSCNSSKSDDSKAILDLEKKKCDSIIYELPAETTKKALSIIGNKKVEYCNLVSNMNENEYIFSFPYTNKYHFSKKDSILLDRTVTFLKLEKYYYPIITGADYIFSKIPNDENINDFNFCFITINAQGKVVNSFAY